MIPYPNIDPIIFRIGPLAVRWYGTMYLLGFGFGYLIIRKRLKTTAPEIKPETIESLVLWSCLGLIVGARLGLILFYHWNDYAYFLSHPLEIIAVWKGGMSFHGGMIGAAIAAFIYMRRHNLPGWRIADAGFLAAPVGLGFGRLGNFINGELYGRATDVPWAMVFPGGGPLPRHPSQLYEMILEGPVLLTILFLMRNRVGAGRLTALFLISYSLFRFAVEFFRQPDAHLGFVAGVLSMGQLLSLAQIGAGLALWVWLGRRQGEGRNQ